MHAATTKHFGRTENIKAAPLLADSLARAFALALARALALALARALAPGIDLSLCFGFCFGFCLLLLLSFGFCFSLFPSFDFGFCLGAADSLALQPSVSQTVMHVRKYVVRVHLVACGSLGLHPRQKLWNFPASAPLALPYKTRLIPQRLVAPQLTVRTCSRPAASSMEPTSAAAQALVGWSTPDQEQETHETDAARSTHTHCSRRGRRSADDIVDVVVVVFISSEAEFQRC